MALHMTWHGAISFGLVHIPVKLYPATTHGRVGFDLLDRRTLDPIGYKKINKANGHEVSADNIVRGVQYEKGHYVVLSDDEIRAANVESTQRIDILAFVDAPQLSFLFLDTPYFLEPDKSGEKVYALLREALAASGKIGVALIVMHGKQHLCAVVSAGPVLSLTTLRWDAEVRSPEELKLPPEGTKANGINPRELEMAGRLIDDMTEEWAPAQYRDTFHDDIMALVQRKIDAGKSHELGAFAAPEEKAPKRGADVVDLSDLLRRSLGGRRDNARAAPASSGRRAAARSPARKRATRG
ncbi:non-homologous end joining protein Ku [Chitinasiproducens palmae]|uniref:Non-homologous end joining protein Ku n=1 Tax=Chitinasiproducens palmae TaxID=1770053 RepID=A0A1H2PW95_9BURK|nr:Ku protein [Chitinasiproducens palmae]SDV51596.1 DNA end-binding protein Ku [Chitinasiproducens palmae]